MKQFGSNGRNKSWGRKVQAGRQVSRIIGGIDNPQTVKWSLQELCQVLGAVGVQYWDDDIGDFSERVQGSCQEISVNSLDFRRGHCRLVLPHPLQQRTQ